MKVYLIVADYASFRRIFSCQMTHPGFFDEKGKLFRCDGHIKDFGEVICPGNHEIAPSIMNAEMALLFGLFS